MALKTMLQVCKEAAYEIGAKPPSALQGSTLPDNLKWLHLLYKVGNEIRRKYDYPTLKRRYSFATESGKKEYELPYDFYRLLLDTQWDETNNWALFGPEDDGGIVGRDKGVVPYGTQYSFRILGAPHQTLPSSTSITEFGTVGGWFEVSPEPTEVRTLYIEYIQKNWFYPRHMVEGVGYVTGDIRSASRKIWKAKTNIGSQLNFPTVTNSQWQEWRDDYNEISNDADYPIIDPDVLVLGLKAAWLHSKGLNGAKAQADFEEAVLESASRFQGSASINGDGPDVYDFPNVSEGFISTGW